MTATSSSGARASVIRFGGVVAADGVDLDVFEGEKPRDHRAERRRQDHVPQHRHRLSEAAGRHGDSSSAGRSPRTRRATSPGSASRAPSRFRSCSSTTRVIENLLIAAAAHGRRCRCSRALHDLPERAEMERLLDLVGSAGRRRAARRGELPEGKRKLVDIAVALALKPRLLLHGRADLGRRLVGKVRDHGHPGAAALAQQRVTSVFVEHDMDMVTRYADRVAVWSAGKIQKIGPPAEVLADPVRPRASDRDLKPCCQLRQGQCLDRRRARAARRHLRAAAGATRRPDRPQRRRQDHDRAHHHGVHGRRPAASGSAAIDLRPVRAAQPRPALGIGYAPEDRRLFSAFTVEENILLPARVAKLDAGGDAAAARSRLYGVLPELAELAAASGGLGVGRAGQDGRARPRADARHQAGSSWTNRSRGWRRCWRSATRKRCAGCARRTPTSRC